MTSRTLPKFGGHQTVYQSVSNDQLELADSVWQYGANWLFVRDTVVILVAEVGGQLTDETTLQIACKILDKLNKVLE